MADIAKEAEVQADERAVVGVSRMANYLWNEVWKRGDKTAEGDADALHDMRVAIRRLRSLLQNFEGESKSKNSAPILNSKLRNEFREQRAELGKLGDVLGFVRDHDVLDEYLKTYSETRLKIKLNAKATEYSGLLVFERFLQNERASAFAPMVKRLNKSRRADALQEEFARWALGLPGASAPDISLREIAHKLLPIRLDEIASYASSLEDGHAESEQHELRKSLRRLRYTFETLAPCFDADIKPIVKKLVALQDLLGEMQDRAVLHDKALEAFGARMTPAESTPESALPEIIPADVAAFLKYGSDRRGRLLSQVRALWKEHQAENLFENLRAL